MHKSIFPDKNVMVVHHLSVGGRLNVGVALLADYVVDVVQATSGDGGKRAGAVGGKVAVGAPGATEVSRALNDHGCRPERLGKRIDMKETCSAFKRRGTSLAKGDDIISNYLLDQHIRPTSLHSYRMHLKLACKLLDSRRSALQCLP